NCVAADGAPATYRRGAAGSVRRSPYRSDSTLSPAAAQRNYNITNAGASFTIDARNATWTTNPSSKTYGDMDPNPLTTGSGTNFEIGRASWRENGRAAGGTVAGGPYHITDTLSPAAARSNE